MTKKQVKKHEEELRKQIQEKLERKYREQQESRKKKSAAHTAGSAQEEYLEQADRELYRMLEDEICSQHPEFVKCENHLGEMRWFTLYELSNDFEFLPVEESRWQKFRNRFFQKKLKDKKLLKRMEELRGEVQKDVARRLEEYKKHLAATKDEQVNDLEKKILEEEIDRFYKNKRGYKKYVNHLGETRWLNQEEFASQDEFIEEVESPARILLRRILGVTAVLIVAALAWFIYQSQQNNDQDRAHLIVNTNQSKGLLYIDKNLAVSFNSGKPYPVSAGEHEISMFSEGYTTIPKVHRVKISKGDTLQISFAFMKKQYAESGVVNIKASVSSAEIILDGEFEGTVERQNRLIVSPGNHTLSLQKSGYICKPRQHIFKINSGDTVNLTFSMNPVKNLRSRKIYQQAVNMGLIEVRSNIKNADIYLDGQKTEFQTDYVLQGVPYGQHIIKVRKKDHKTYPDERVVKLDKNNKRSSVDFTLSSTVRRISIQTSPVKGTIYIDGKAMGEGLVRVPIPLGQHTIDFSDVPHYHKPAAKSFRVSDSSPDKLIFNYRTNFAVQFSTAGATQVNQKGSLNSGYLLGDDSFRLSRKAGPEIIRDKAAGISYWKMGYAFPYRNPSGRDALEFNFYVPENVDLSQPVYLKIWAYQTKDFYPLVIKGVSAYSIEINRTKFRKEVKPKYAFSKRSEKNFDRFQINDQIHPGYNRIGIATTKSSSAHLALWKIKIDQSN